MPRRGCPETKLQKRRRRAKLLVLLLPLLSIGVALWGTTWGWNSDNLFYPELAGYVVAAYALFAGSQLLTYIPGIRKWFDEGKLKPLGQDGFGLIFWGFNIVLVSVVLIQLFESSALWLGSMSSFYTGFGIIMAGVLWHFGKSGK